MSSQAMRRRTVDHDERFFSETDPKHLVDGWTSLGNLLDDDGEGILGWLASSEDGRAGDLSEPDSASDPFG